MSVCLGEVLHFLREFSQVAWLVFDRSLKRGIDHERLWLLSQDMSARLLYLGLNKLWSTVWLYSDGLVVSHDVVDYLDHGID